MAETNPAIPLEVVKIDDCTYRIEDNGVRSLLFIGDTLALLIDTGFGASGSLKAVIESLTDKPVILVNTHADFDHLGNNTEFDTAHMHPAEMTHYFQTAKPDAPVTPLWDGDIINIGGRAFEVILIPGHTPGSIALLDRENRILVSGDSISAGPVFMFGEMRNFCAYIASMEKLIDMSGAFDTIYPSHGPFPIASGQVKKQLAAANKLIAGEIISQDPPFEIPAKIYEHDGASFFY